MTIWRDNCQRQGILSTKPKEDETSKQDYLEMKKVYPIQVEADHSLKRGEVIPTSNHWLGLKRTLVTGCGSLHVNSYWDPNTGELRECFLSKGSTGGCNNFMVGLSRMISLAARGGIGVDKILDQLKSCGTCPSYAVRQATQKDCSKGSCCPVAVGNALRDMHKEIQDIICECEKNKNSESSKSGSMEDQIIGEVVQQMLPELIELEECPSCHEQTLIHSNGCVSCPSCGWSKCS